MIINHNMNAMNAHRNMGMNTNAAGKSMEKLSSGLRINRAGDDAAGLAISEKMRGQIKGLDQASRNSQDGISMIQTAEGALNETQNILQRMRELSVQSSNDTNTAGDRTEIQKEIEQLTEEIDRIGNNTEFNTQSLLKGDGGVALDKTGALNITTNVDGGVTHTQASGSVKFAAAATKGDTLSIEIAGKKIDVEISLTATPSTGAAGAATDYAALLNAAISKDDDLKGQFTVVANAETITIEAVAGGKYDGAAGTVSKATVETAAGAAVTTATNNAGVGTTTQDAAAAEIKLEALTGTPAKADALKSVQDLLGKGFEINGEKVEFYNVKDGSYKGDAVGVDISRVLEAVEGAVAANLTTAEVQAVNDALITSIVDQVGSKLQGVTITAGAAAGEMLIETTQTGVGAKLDIKDGATKGDFEASFQVGANESQTISVKLSDMRAEALGVGKIDVSSKDAANKSITTLDNAVKSVSSERAKLGAVQNRLEYTTKNLENTSENLQAAESRIRDVDMAKEMLTFSKNNILQQAAQSMLAQAKSQPEGVLQLLR